MFSRIFLICLVITGIFLTRPALAQPQLGLPLASQAAEISQVIGLSRITINYHRPGVNGREIWGKLVPFGEVWRAGANENTTIMFESPVEINGNVLPAGTYGLHMIPTTENWTVIFSNISSGWGSYGYDLKEDALRISVKPESAPFEERLSFRFDNPAENSVVVALYWEKLKIPFTVKLNVQLDILESFRRELRGLPQFFWQPWNQAANFCLQNDINTDQAIQWVDQSIAIIENFANLQVKSALLEKKGQLKEAEELMKRAMKIAKENEINQYGYQLLGAGKVDQAIDIFKKNVKDHPDSWNVYDSLGEGYATKGDTKNALELYSKALKMVKDDTEKKRITGILEKLKSK